ncbi:MAG: SRPBCC family protein [Flavobacteriales bacterium]|nr:SRPBCC family protein [Flavobacteriales bacterium]
MLALYIVLGIVVFLVVLSFLMGNKMVIEKSVLISKSRKEIYDYLKFTQNQDYFSVWNMKDPNMDKKFQNEDGKVGFIYTWNSLTDKGVGEGEQEIIAMKDEEFIEYQVRFKKPMQNTVTTRFILESKSENETLLTWGFYSPSKFPMNLFKPILVNLLGKDIQKSLDTLKGNLN